MSTDGYRERPSRIPGAFVWGLTHRSGDDTRVLPDGCMDLIWIGGTLIVAGPDTAATASGPVPVVVGDSATYVGLRFAPGDAPVVLGVPASELRDQRVLLDDLWPTAMVRQFADHVSAAPDRGSALEEIVLRLPGLVRDRAVAGIVASLSAGGTVAATAEALDMGERRLHRRCLDAFGYGPKTLGRVLRLQRALALARAGTGFATVAAEAGYADQAHLARDVKALAGVPLSALV
jgi:AraC-like DNA-binding protein